MFFLNGPGQLLSIFFFFFFFLFLWSALHKIEVKIWVLQPFLNAGSPWNPPKIFLKLSGYFYLTDLCKKKSPVETRCVRDIIGQDSILPRWTGELNLLQIKALMQYIKNAPIALQKHLQSLCFSFLYF